MTDLEKLAERIEAASDGHWVFVTSGGVIGAFPELTLTAERLQALVASWRRRGEALEKLPEVVPTTWLDPLLSGPDAVVGKNTDCRVIEALLRGVQDRLRLKAQAALKEQK
jgi:hypothetical protein